MSREAHHPPVIIISHALGSYPVMVEAGALLSLPRVVADNLPGRRIALITDTTVERLYDGWTVAPAEPGPRDAPLGEGRLHYDAWLSFPAGEASKTRETWAGLTDEMLQRGFGRDSAIVALGGGVVGDMAGFVAATFLRGIPFLQVPTTLLAMLDASVGGKVGVDTPRGKNLVGAFHPPAAVVADPLTLRDQPEREFRHGLAEAVKHGLIADRAYFEWIEQRVRELKDRQLDTLSTLIRRSIEIKATVVIEDERESGRRAILNAGHTVAHAVEQASAYLVPHGEAVALGLIAECRIAERAGIASAGLTDRVTRLLHQLGFRARLRSGASRESILGAMASDKKNRAGEIRLALPTGVGTMHVRDGDWTLSVALDVIAEGVNAIA